MRKYATTVNLTLMDDEKPLVVAPSFNQKLRMERLQSANTHLTWWDIIEAGIDYFEDEEDE